MPSVICTLCKRVLDLDSKSRIPRHTLPSSDAQCLNDSDEAEWVSEDERTRAAAWDARIRNSP